MGEKVAASLSNVTLTTSGTSYNAGSLSLSAGVWLVFTKFAVIPPGTTHTNTDVSISTTSATADNTNLVRNSSTALVASNLATSAYYVLGSTATIYAVASSSFTGTSPATAATSSALYAVRIA